MSTSSSAEVGARALDQSADHDAPFSVLVVCTGNICRSPIGEHLLRDHFRNALGAASASFVVVSAGTYSGHAGGPMDAGAAAVLRERGLTPDSFRAQALTAAQIARADLVMTAEPAHRAAVARLDPTALRRAFTIPELGALASAAAASTDVLVDVATDVATGVAVGSAPGPTPAAQARAVVGRLAALRGTVLVPEGAAGMIPDPYGGSLGQFREVAELIDTALAPFVRLVAPSTSSGQGSAVGHGPHP